MAMCRVLEEPDEGQTETCQGFCHHSVKRLRVLVAAETCLCHPLGGKTDSPVVVVVVQGGGLHPDSGGMTDALVGGQIIPRETSCQALVEGRRNEPKENPDEINLGALTTIGTPAKRQSQNSLLSKANPQFRSG